MNTFGKLPVNPQELRVQSLQWQLIALDSQSKILHNMALEHALGVENLNPDALVAEVHDLVESAKRLVRNAGSVPPEETLHAINIFHGTARLLKDRSMTFEAQARLRAQFRLANTLGSLYQSACGTAAHTTGDDESEGVIPMIPSSPDDKKIPCEPRLLMARANRSCFKAETEQYQAFMLQLKSICNLANEMVFVAASQHGIKNI